MGAQALLTEFGEELPAITRRLSPMIPKCALISLYGRWKSPHVRMNFARHVKPPPCRKMGLQPCRLGPEIDCVRTPQLRPPVQGEVWY